MLNMKKIWLFLILILGIFIISGCGKKVIDCGIDTKCFSNNFKTCTPSKIYGGLTQVVGGTKESCNVLLYSAEDPLFTKRERLSMQCSVKNVNTFKDEEMNMLGIMDKSSSCQGTLYDQMNEIIQSANQNK